MTLYQSVAIQHAEDGSWRELKLDIHAIPGVSYEYGIRSNNIADRTGTTGTMSFILDNDLVMGQYGSWYTTQKAAYASTVGGGPYTPNNRFLDSDGAAFDLFNYPVRDADDVAVGDYWFQIGNRVRLAVWEDRVASTKDGAYVGAVSFEQIRTATEFGTRYVPVLPGSSSAIDLFTTDTASDFDGTEGSLFVGLAAMDDWTANGTRREIAKIAATANLNFDGVLGSDAAAPTVGATGIGDGRSAFSFDGGDYVNVFTSDLADAFDGSKGTALAWVRIDDATVWADKVTRGMLRFAVDGDNFLDFRKYGNMDTWAKEAGEATTEFDSEVDAGASLNATTDAAKVGTNGFKFTFDDATAGYGRFNASAIDRTQGTLEFWLNPNSFALDDGKTAEIVYFLDGSSNVTWRMRLNRSGANYTLITLTRTDAGGFPGGGPHTISSATAYVHVRLVFQRSTGAGNNDGYTRFIVDDNGTPSTYSLTGIDNDAQDWDQMRIGVNFTNSVGFGGSWFFDEVKLSEDLPDPAVQLVYEAGTTSVSVADESLASTTDWFLLGMTWDKAADAMKAYVNGAQAGSTQTGLGTWTGSLATALLGAISTASSGSHIGLMAHAAVYDEVLSADQMAAIFAEQAGDMRGAILAYVPIAYWMLDEDSGETAASETNAAGSHAIDIYHTSDGVPTIEYSAAGVVHSWAGAADVAGTSDAPTQVVMGLSWSADQVMFYMNPSSDTQAVLRASEPTLATWNAAPTLFVLGASTSDGSANALKAAFTGAALWTAEVDSRNLFPMNHHLNWFPDWLVSIEHDDLIGYWPLTETTGTTVEEWGQTPFYFKFSGRVQAINPDTGKFSNNAVRVTALDWLDDAARFRVGAVPTQTDVSIDEAILQLVQYSASQPPGVILTPGVDELPFTTHDIRGVNAILGEISKLAATEFGYVYMRGTVNSEGVPGMALANESRHSRVTNTTPAYTLTDDPTSDVITDIGVQQSMDRLRNTVEITTHPADIDSDNVVVSSLPADVVLEIPGKGSFIYGAKYLDSDNAFKVVGAASIVSPVRNTDYLINTTPTGNGVDVTNDYRQQLLAIDSDNLLAYYILNDPPGDAFRNDTDNTGKKGGAGHSKTGQKKTTDAPTITGVIGGNKGFKVATKPVDLAPGLGGLQVFE